MNDALGNPALVLLFGVVSMFVTSLFTQHHWSDAIKQAVAIGVACIFGALALWLRIAAGAEALTPETLIGHLTATFVAATACYWFLLKDGGSPAATFNRWLQGVGAPKWADDPTFVEGPLFSKNALIMVQTPPAVGVRDDMPTPAPPIMTGDLPPSAPTQGTVPGNP